MYVHRIGSIVLRSSCRLPEVPSATLEHRGSAAGWMFHLHPRRVRGSRPLLWQPRPGIDRWLRQTRLPDGRQWLSIARQGERYLLRFHRLADFQVDRASRAIACVPASRATPATVRHLLLDQVLPMVASGERTLPLHASAVRGRGGIVGFLGPAGSGKSTLAVSLARRGWALVCDDCLLVDAGAHRVRARPIYPGPRLHADSLAAIYGGRRTAGTPVAQYTRKQRIDPSRAGMRVSAAAPARIQKLYVLTPDARLSPGRPRVAPLSPRAAMLELLRFTFHLDLDDRLAIASRFELAAFTAQRVPASRLSFRHDLTGLEALRARVEADLTE